LRSIELRPARTGQNRRCRFPLFGGIARLFRISWQKTDLVAGAQPFSLRFAKKARYFEDRGLTERVLLPPKSSPLWTTSPRTTPTGHAHAEFDADKHLQAERLDGRRPADRRPRMSAHPQGRDPRPRRKTAVSLSRRFRRLRPR